MIKKKILIKAKCVGWFRDGGCREFSPSQPQAQNTGRLCLKVFKANWKKVSSKRKKETFFLMPYVWESFQRHTQKKLFICMSQFVYHFIVCLCCPKCNFSSFFFLMIFDPLKNKVMPTCNPLIKGWNYRLWPVWTCHYCKSNIVIDEKKKQWLEESLDL